MRGCPIQYKVMSKTSVETERISSINEKSPIVKLKLKWFPSSVKITILIKAHRFSFLVQINSHFFTQSLLDSIKLKYCFVSILLFNNAILHHDIPTKLF